MFTKFRFLLGNFCFLKLFFDSKRGNTKGKGTEFLIFENFLLFFFWFFAEVINHAIVPIGQLKEESAEDPADDVNINSCSRVPK